MAGRQRDRGAWRDHWPGAVIGAGSVVTKDIPPMVLAAGNPCRVVRPITEGDRTYYYKNWPFTQRELEEMK